MSGSLSKAPGFVASADYLRVRIPFVPEDVTLGVFTFLPWVRTGLAAALVGPAPGALRATVNVSMSVQDADGGSEPVSQTIVLRGPGDVVALDPTQIVRRIPAPDTINAEESFLAHVEFDRPELPWLFSPFAPPADDRLQPWLALVVCNASLAQLLPGAPGRPMVLDTPLGELPSLLDAWAWAHAQVAGPRDAAAGGATVADRLTDEHGPANLSRVVSPRKLDPNRSWIACLVPTFDCGVKAGLGLAGGTLDPAWTREAGGGDAARRVLLPVYDSWRFSTGPAGDFEKLAKRLEGVVAPWNVGRRIVDATRPQGNLPPLPDGAAGRVQVLRCALVSPTPMPDGAPPEGANWDAPTRDLLRAEIDRANAPEDDLPRVGPRLYAKFQRGASALGAVFGVPPAQTDSADRDWFPQLNTSPMHRVVAGLGTRVVQKDQEPLMQAAWAQVGEIASANRVLARAQFGRYVGGALHRAHLSRLDAGVLAQVLRGVQGKVRAEGSARTVYGEVRASRVAPAAMTAAFRRATRVRGPLFRFTDAAARVSLRGMLTTPSGFRDFRTPYVEPDGVRTLSEGAIRALTPALVASRLGVAESAAPGALAGRLAGRANTPSIADRVLSPVAAWRLPAGTLDLGGILAAGVAERVNAAMPADAGKEPARAEALASLLVGIANSSAASVSPGVIDRINRVGTSLPFSGLAAPHGLPGGIGLPPGVLERPGGVVSPHAGARDWSRPVGTRVPTPAIGIGSRLPTGPRFPTPAPPPPAPPPPDARQRFETPVSRVVTDAVNASRAVPALDVARALSDLLVGSGVLALPPTPDRPPLAVHREALLRSVDPAFTVTAYARSRIARLPPWLPKDWFDDLRIAPIMAAPHFDVPMYEALDRYGRDWLVPGLGEIPKTDFVTLLHTNPVFTEAFLVGLSDEMGRELLWREYPTDQRGTYFRRFWDAGHDELAADIHRFSRTPLGTHLTDDSGASGHVVLVVRGEVVRRYPDALVLAHRQINTQDGHPVFSEDMATILFHAQLPPDILIVGFRLTPEQVGPENWWFFIAEHPTAPRFGLELVDQGNPRAPGAAIDRAKLDWNDLTGADARLDLGRFLSPRGRTLMVNDANSRDVGVQWPGTAAAVARTLLRDPVRAAFNGQKLIAPALH